MTNRMTTAAAAALDPILRLATSVALDKRWVDVPDDHPFWLHAGTELTFGDLRRVKAFLETGSDVALAPVTPDLQWGKQSGSGIWLASNSRDELARITSHFEGPIVPVIVETRSDGEVSIAPAFDPELRRRVHSAIMRSFQFKTFGQENVEGDFVYEAAEFAAFETNCEIATDRAVAAMTGASFPDAARDDGEVVAAIVPSEGLRSAPADGEVTITPAAGDVSVENEKEPRDAPARRVEFGIAEYLDQFERSPYAYPSTDRGTAVALVPNTPVAATPEQVETPEDLRSALADAATRIADLEEKNGILEQAVEHYRELAEEGTQPLVDRMRFEDGSFNLAVTGPVVEAVAMALVGQFKEGGSTNYMVLNLSDRDEPHQRYTVTVQKVGGLSPAEKAAAAEALLTRTRDVLADLADAARSATRAAEHQPLVDALIDADALLVEARTSRERS